MSILNAHIRNIILAENVTSAREIRKSLPLHIIQTSEDQNVGIPDSIIKSQINLIKKIKRSQSYLRKVLIKKNISVPLRLVDLKDDRKQEEIMKFIQKTLNQNLLLKYHLKIPGFCISYCNLKKLKEHVHIHYENPSQIVVPVSVEAFVFCPCPGMLVPARVFKITGNEVQVKLLNYFFATLTDGDDLNIGDDVEVKILSTKHIFHSKYVDVVCSYSRFLKAGSSGFVEPDDTYIDDDEMNLDITTTTKKIKEQQKLVQESSSDDPNENSDSDSENESSESDANNDIASDKSSHNSTPVTPNDKVDDLSRPNTTLMTTKEKSAKSDHSGSSSDDEDDDGKDKTYFEAKDLPLMPIDSDTDSSSDDDAMGLSQLKTQMSQKRNDSDSSDDDAMGLSQLKTQISQKRSDSDSSDDDSSEDEKEKTKSPQIEKLGKSTALDGKDSKKNVLPESSDSDESTVAKVKPKENDSDDSSSDSDDFGAMGGLSQLKTQLSQQTQGSYSDTSSDDLDSPVLFSSQTEKTELGKRKRKEENSKKRRKTD